MADPIASAYLGRLRDRSPVEGEFRRVLEGMGLDPNGQPLPQEAEVSPESAAPAPPSLDPALEVLPALPSAQTPARFEDPRQAARRFRAQQTGRLFGMEIPLVSPTLRRIRAGTDEALIQIATTIDEFATVMEMPTSIGPSLRQLSPAFGAPDNMAGALVQNLSQFLTGFTLAYGTAGVAGVTGVAATVPSTFFSSFAAMDPDQPNMANLLEDLAPSVRGPVIEFLATRPDDETAEAQLLDRLGNAVTETTFDVMAEGIFNAARVLRWVKELLRRGPQTLEPLPSGGAPPGQLGPGDPGIIETLREGRMVQGPARTGEEALTAEQFFREGRTLQRPARTGEEALTPQEMVRLGRGLPEGAAPPAQITAGQTIFLPEIRDAERMAEMLARVGQDPAESVEVLVTRTGVPRKQAEALVAQAVRDFPPFEALALPPGAQPAGLLSESQTIFVPMTREAERMAEMLARVGRDPAESVEVLVNRTGVPRDEAQALVDQAVRDFPPSETLALPPGRPPAKLLPEAQTIFLPATGEAQTLAVMLARTPREAEEIVDILVSDTGVTRETAQDLLQTAQQDRAALRAAPQGEAEAVPGAAPTAAPRGRVADLPVEELELQQFIKRQGGLTLGDSSIAGEFRRTLVPGGRPPRLINNKTGLSPAQMAQRAQEAGFITTPDEESLLRALQQSIDVSPVRSSQSRAALDVDLPPLTDTQQTAAEELIDLLDDDLKKFLGERGSVEIAQLAIILQTGTGAVIGGALSDPEERLRGVFIGAGVGALTAGVTAHFLNKAAAARVGGEAAEAGAEQAARGAAGEAAEAGAEQAARGTAETVEEAAEQVRQAAGEAPPLGFQARQAAQTAAQAVGDAAARAAGPTARAFARFTELADEEAEELAAQVGRAMPEGVPQGVRLDINFDRLTTSDDVKTTLAQMSDLFSKEIEGARRLGTSQDETAQLAQAMGLTVEQLLALGDGGLLNSQTAFATRQLLVTSAERLRVLADGVVSGGPGAVESFLRQFSLHGEIQRVAAQIRSEAGRTLAIFRRDAEGEVQYLAGIEQALRRQGVKASPGTTPVRLAQMVQALGDPRQLNLFSRQMTNPRASNALLELWIQGLLSGPQTQAVNVLSNGLTTLWAIPERALAAGTSLVTGGDISFLEPVAQLYGLVQGFQDSFRTASRAFRENTPQMGTFRATEMESSFTSQAFRLGQDTLPGRFVDFLGTHVVNIPSRLLLTGDEFFKGMNYSMELHAQSLRAAARDGGDVATKVQRMQDVLKDPSAEILDSAKDYAFYQTFQQSLTQEGVAFTRLGQAASDLRQMTNRHPALRLFLPFIRTPTNILRYTLERTPVLALASRQVRADLAAGGTRAALASAKMATGTAAVATVAALAANGRITGRGPSDPRLRRDLEARGWKQYSVFVGGKYIAYDRLDPVGMLMAQGADLAGLAGVDPNNTEALEEAVVSTVVAQMRNFSNKTYMRGLSQMIDILSPPGYAQDRVALNPGFRVLSSLVASAEPAVIRQLSRAMDPVRRDSESIIDRLASQTPGYSKTVPASRDIFGDPVLYGHGLGEGLVNVAYRFLSPLRISDIQQSPGAELLTTLALPLSKPSRNIEGVRLTNEEYETYQVLAGHGLKLGQLGFKEQVERLAGNAVFARLSGGPEGRQALEIRRLSQLYRRGARRTMLDPRSPHFQPDLARRVRDARLETREQQRGTADVTLPPGLEPALRSLEQGAAGEVPLSTGRQ